MPSIDELTMDIYGNIQRAIAGGNVLAYANQLAARMIGQNMPAPRSTLRENRGFDETNTARPSIRPPTPEPSSVHAAIEEQVERNRETRAPRIPQQATPQVARGSRYEEDTVGVSDR